MNNSYQIDIVNGQGTQNILNGTYNVTANVNAYDNATIDPSTLTIVEGTNEYSLKIGATGVLTLHVTEDGTSGGTPIVGATFIRTDASGTTYGSSITTDSSGNAVFNNVPYSATGAPLIYYKQTSSDGSHEFSPEVVNTSLTESTKTVEIANASPAPRTVSLTDLNYDGLKVESGQINLSQN